MVTVRHGGPPYGASSIGRMAARTGASAQSQGQVQPIQADPDQLTPRELEVLAQLVTGSTYKEISQRLGMAPKTVMHHSGAIYRKLGVRGRAEAIAWAFRHGVVN